MLLHEADTTKSSPAAPDIQPEPQNTSTPIRIVVDRGTSAKTDFEDGVPMLLSEIGSTRDVNKEVIRTQLKPILKTPCNRNVMTSIHNLKLCFYVTINFTFIVAIIGVYHGPFSKELVFMLM